MTAYAVKNIELAGEGRLQIEWAEANMGALKQVKERFTKEKPLQGLRVGMALHVTKETAVLVRVLRAGGATVVIAGCNPLSTQDEVAAALAAEGVAVYAHRGESPDDYYRFLHQVILSRPQITIDDGCDLVSAIHLKHSNLLPEIIGGAEETTTGVLRLQAMAKAGELKYPVIAVNDNLTKHLMDNYYGTGQSTLDGITRATNLLWAGKTVVVAGYGSCGKGCALRAKGLGAEVIVTEVNPFRALQARLDGFAVMPMAAAAKKGDVFITVTGNKKVIRLEHIKQMKDGAVLANSGHFDVEIDVKGLRAEAKGRLIRPHLEEFTVAGKKIHLLGEGRLINLTAAEGHPAEVMSLSFCGQALACEYLVKNRGRLKAGVITLPAAIDEQISRLQLQELDIKIDSLNAEQKQYLADWREGT